MWINLGGQALAIPDVDVVVHDFPNQFSYGRRQQILNGRAKKVLGFTAADEELSWSGEDKLDQLSIEQRIAQFAAAACTELLGLLVPERGTTEIFDAICGELGALARMQGAGLLWGGSPPHGTP